MASVIGTLRRGAYSRRKTMSSLLLAQRFWLGGNSAGFRLLLAMLLWGSSNKSNQAKGNEQEPATRKHIVFLLLLLSKLVRDATDMLAARTGQSAKMQALRDAAAQVIHDKKQPEVPAAYFAVFFQMMAEKHAADDFPQFRYLVDCFAAELHRSFSVLATICNSCV